MAPTIDEQRRPAAGDRPRVPTDGSEVVERTRCPIRPGPRVLQGRWRWRACRFWVAPADGAEPYLLHPSLVRADPVTNTVLVDPTAIPADAVVWLLYRPA